MKIVIDDIETDEISECTGMFVPKKDDEVKWYSVMDSDFKTGYVKYIKYEFKDDMVLDRIVLSVSDVDD